MLFSCRFISPEPQKVALVDNYTQAYNLLHILVSIPTRNTLKYLQLNQFCLDCFVISYNIL